MDETRFDRLARVLGGLSTRRGTVLGLMGGLLIPLGSSDDSDAKQHRGQRSRHDRTRLRRGEPNRLASEGKRKKSKKKKKSSLVSPPPPPPPPQTPPCPDGTTRCGDACVNVKEHVNHCGSCGNACPGTGETATATCENGTCRLTCIGEHYDVNGNPADGCEQESTFAAHSRETAASLGSRSCLDTDRGSFSGTIFSDDRDHDPSIPGYNPDTGAAPHWWKVFANDSQFFCLNTVELSLTMTGGSNGCYRVTAITDKTSQSADVVDGTARISLGPSGQYTTKTNVYFSLEKTCGREVREAASFTAGFNL